MEQNRREVGTKKKLRKGRFLLTILIICLAISAIYFILQYRSGMKLAGEHGIKVGDFVGDEEHAKVENFLLIGVDSRGEEKSRSDSMMILSRDKETNDLKIVSLMRDIYADIPGYKSYKLNTAYYLGGVQLLKDTITHMFEVPIHHYAVIDFKNFEQLIDVVAPDGIEITVEKDMSENIDVELKQGTHHLNGKELLGYARFRMDADSDFGRVARQQKVIEALKNQVVSVTTVPKIPKLLGAAKGYIATDVTNKEQLATLTKIIMSGGASIEKLTIPEKNAFSYKNYPHAGSVIELDLPKNKQALHDFLQLNE